MTGPRTQPDPTLRAIRFAGNVAAAVMSTATPLLVVAILAEHYGTRIVHHLDTAAAQSLVLPLAWVAVAAFVADGMVAVANRWAVRRQLRGLGKQVTR